MQPSSRDDDVKISKISVLFRQGCPTRNLKNRLMEDVPARNLTQSEQFAGMP